MMPWLLGAVVLAAQVPVAQPTDHGFVLSRGPDTIAVERVRGVAGDGSGELRLVPTRQRFRWQWTPDSVVAEAIAGGNAPQRSALATRAGTGFYLNPSMALLEVSLAAGLRRSAAADTVPVLLPGGSLLRLTLTRAAPDTAVVSLGGVAIRLHVDATGRVLGGAIPSQGLTFARVAWLDDATMAGTPPDYSAPAGAPYTAENVAVPTPKGHTLGCTFTRPAGAAKVPALVLFTGSGPQERDEYLGIRGYRPFRQLADTLGRRGIAVLRCDDRGVGASGGNFATATSRDFADDGVAQVAWLAARADVGPIAVGGHSEGGLIAPLVAVDVPAVAAVVLLAGPAYTGRRIIQYQTTDIARDIPGISAAQRDSALARGPALRDSILASSPWMQFFGAYDPLPTARRLTVPVLVLQGRTDRQVTPEQADTLASAMRRAGNRQVTLRVFPQTNHLFLRDSLGWAGGYSALPDTRLPGEITGTVAEWLERTLMVPGRVRPRVPRGNRRFSL
jgi:uncharacterized protein